MKFLLVSYRWVRLVRTFYIFKINKELSILLGESPYTLFKALESIYLMDKENVGVGRELLEQVSNLINTDAYNRLIYEKNKDNDFYQKIGNRHRIYNKYRQEETIITVKNTHILLTTNVLPKNINLFLPTNDLFVCDFANRDYFWLSRLVAI